jgi:hypothetical protein
MEETTLFKRKLERVFTKRGKEGMYVKLFDSLPAPQQQRLLDLFPIRQFELPVIGGEQPSTFSLLLTTERLYWQGDDKRLEVELNKVARVVFDPNVGGMSPRSKAEATELKIETNVGEQNSITVEEGYPYFGLLNVLMFIGLHNVGGTIS